MAQQSWLGPSRNDNLPQTTTRNTNDGNEINDGAASQTQLVADILLKDFIQEWRQRLVGKRLIMKSAPASVVVIRSNKEDIRRWAHNRLFFPDAATVHRKLAEADQEEQYELSIPPSDNDFHSKDLPPTFQVQFPDTVVQAQYIPSRVVVQLDRRGIITGLSQG